MTFTWPASNTKSNVKLSPRPSIAIFFLSYIVRNGGSIVREFIVLFRVTTRVKRETDERVVRFNNERCNVALAGSYSRGCREIDDSRPGIGNNVLPVFRVTRRFVNVSASRTGSRTIY